MIEQTRSESGAEYGATRRHMRITDLTLAYRQAKSALFYERRGIGMLHLAAYEESLGANLARLSQSHLETSWFDEVDIGNAVVVPKGVAVPAIAPAKTLISIGAPRVRPVDISVRLQLSPCPDFAIVEVLYIWEFGAALDALLGTSAIGYRLKLVDGVVDRTSRHLFEFWPKTFARYRDEPIEKARRYLGEGGGACTITSLDFSAFYDSIDPSFMLSDSFVNEVSDVAGRRGISFDRDRYVSATSSLLRSFRRFRDMQENIVRHSNSSDVRFENGIPIGALTSRLVANVVLYRLDRMIDDESSKICYCRYVDDIVVVRRSPNPPPDDASDFLMGWFPGLTVVGQQFNVDVGTGNVLSFQSSKTRIHHLVGQPGIDFLEIVRESFAAVASERRAFATDIEPIAEELEVLSNPHVQNRSRLVALRDGDREILERGRTGALFQSLQRTVRLLSPDEAGSLFRKHETRLEASIDTHTVWENLDAVLSILRVAQMTRQVAAPPRVVAALEIVWGPLARAENSLGIVRWNGQILEKRKTVFHLINFVRQRVVEAIAAASPMERKQLLALKFHRVPGAPSARFMEASARRLRRADLRSLDREDDCALFPEATSEVGDHSELDLIVRRERDLAPRMKRIDDLIAVVRELRDSVWDMTPMTLFLSTRPPTYFDVSRRLLYRQEQQNGYDAEAFDRILDAVNAVSGSRYRGPVGSVVDSDSVAIDPRPHSDYARLILGNLVLDDSWFKGAMEGAPVLSYSRFAGLRRVLDAARRAARARRTVDGAVGTPPPALLVLPELSVPRQWYRELGRYIARDERMGLVVGVEYLLDRARGVVVNQAFGVFPGGGHSVTVIPWTKRNPAQGEKIELAKLGLSLRKSKRHVRTVADTSYGRLSVLICSEILEPQALAGLVGRTELIVVPSWNKDIHSYDHMLRSASLLIHAYVAVANNGHYSDCRAWAPKGEPAWSREVCRLVQRDADEVVWADIEVGKLRGLHESADGTENYAPWRPLPPSWQ